MNNIIILFCMAVVAYGAPQYGGGSGGGLLGHHQPLSYQIIGLSGGNDEHEEEGGYGGQSGGYGGQSGGYGGQSGGYGGQSGGDGGQSGGDGDQSGGYGGHSGGYGGRSSGDGGHSGGEGGEYGGHEYKHEESLGFTGSDFKTPVDVHHEKEIHLKAHPEYHYDYHVADHKHKDYKSKHESRDGYKVKGSYSLLEPDHKTIRVVDYVADKKLGFVAKVSYKKHQ